MDLAAGRQFFDVCMCVCKGGVAVYYVCCQYPKINFSSLVHCFFFVLPRTCFGFLVSVIGHARCCCMNQVGGGCMGLWFLCRAPSFSDVLS